MKEIEINGIKIDPQYYIDKWTNWALEATPATDEQVTENVQWLYEKGGLKKPKVMIFREWEDFESYNWSSVRSSVESSVRSSVWSSVWSSVESSVRSSVESSVRSSVRSSVESSVRSSVWSSVRSSVESSVRSSVGSWYWASELAFAEVFTDTKILSEEKSKELEKYKQILETQRMAVFTKDICYVLVAPIIRRDNGQLHSDQLPAVQWGKTGLYYLDGVNMPKNIWQKIISKEMSFSDIMKIEISDQRTVALKYNPQAIIKENATLIHKDDRNNELYLIEGKEINTFTNFPKMYFLKMLCPTGRIFIEGVPPEEAEKNPNATDMQALLCGLTKSEYLSMSLES